MKRFTTTLIASALLAGFGLSASAADLPTRNVQTTQDALPGKAGARYHSTHVTAVSWQVGSGYTRSFGYGFPIVLGVAY